MKLIICKRLQIQGKVSKMSKKKIGVKKALNSKTQIVPNKDIQAQSPKGRPPRRPLSQISKLSIPNGIKEKGFEYRWILEKTERIEAFEAAWWEQVKDGTGKPVKKASGENGYLLLYKIPFEYYEEDVKEKQKLPINLLTEKAKLTKGDKYSSEYVPEGQQGVVVINN